MSGPQLGISISEIIVDSEGLIVGAGRIVGNQFFSDKTLAFRFNPTAFQMLWVRQFDSNSATEGGILEKTPGGNYLLYHNPDPMPTGGAQKAEILELDRTTGQIVPAFANRYQHFQNQTLQSMVAYGGALYATGFADTVISGLGARRRVLITKLDASTGQVIWSRIGPKDWSKVAYYLGGDLIVDGNNLLTLYHGNETGNSISGNGKIAPMFLQKTTLDGEVLWVKKYMVTAFPREVVAVPDGYVLFGGYAKRYLLKTDKEGNLLVSKELKSTQYFIVHDNDSENQIERIGSSLFIASNTGIGSQLGQYTTLLKTDLNLDMEFPCGLASNPVSDSTVVNPANIAVQQTVTASPALQQGLAMTLASDGMTIKENCPVCSDPVCSDRPDLTAHVDSITCSFFDGTIAYVNVCNLGKVAPIDGFNLTFYDKNPLASGAAVLQSVFLEEKPDSTQCLQAVVHLDAALLQHPKIYTLVGVKGDVQPPLSLSGFPYPGGFAECNYANNLDSFATLLPPIQKLDLGPDRKICTGQTVTLDAGSGYVLYNWSAGTNTQAYTTDATGSFAVEVIDACGRKQRDTVQVTVLPYPTRAVSIVLLPGDSVVIGGITYKGATTLVDTVPSLTGGCDTVLTYQVRLDSLHCPKAASFLKTYKGGLGRVVQPAADGGYYIGGEANEQAAISDKEIVKMDAAGKVLWTRTFDFLLNFAFDALLEDSEGRLVVLATSLAAPSSIAVFRYDPAADQVLWIQRMTPPQTDVFAFDLFEKSPGGDYLIAYRLRKNNTELSTEICSLDRTTGSPVGGEVWHYEPHAWVNAVALHQNALYANGLLRDPADPGVTYRYGLMKIDLNTGEPLWSRLTTAVQPGLDLGSGDVLVDGAGDVVSTVSEPGKAIGLQKTAPNGDLVWLKRLQFNEPLASNFIPKSIVLLNDGYLISADPFFNGASTNALFFVKTNFNGDVVWAKKLSKAGAGYTSGSPNLLAVRAGKGCFIANVIHQGFLFADMALGQMDADGNLGEGCTLLENASVTLSNQTATQDPALVTFSILSRTFTSLPPTTSKAAQLLPTTLCTKCLPPCEDVAVTKTIQFYPGDTITIDGVAYTQSDTVVQNFTTLAGCDSVVTNILQRILTELSISCPSDLTVTLPPNEIKTVVDYTLPTATTTCPDSTISLRLLQGLPVGGSFSQGKTLVCYEAANKCGIRDTCCFSITALPPDPACDVKTPSGCVRYELLGIRLDAQGQRRYRVRITNLCASPLEFAYIQLPNGVSAVSPVQGATYTAPGGNAYTVRNPNASPFYSIRYQAVVGNLNNGKSNVFEYTLPQQAQPSYIRASARLADGSYSETHLNTFYCPEVIENLELRMENFSRSSSSAPFSILNSQLLVRPNPTSGALYWRFDFESNLQSETPVHLRVLNAQGQLVLERDCVIDAEEVRLDLPAELASGLYYLVAQPEGGERAAARFVLER